MEKKDKPVLERWHGAHHYSNKIHLLFVVVLFFFVGVFLWSYVEIGDLQTKIANSHSATPTSSPSPTPEQVFCTMEAKACPDGVNYVGRSGPNCDFAACPGQHCGGNIKDAPKCGNGFHCQLNISNPDTGGTCVSDAASTSPSPTLSCTPRPKCLDSKPRCLIAETENMCPPSTSP